MTEIESLALLIANMNTQIRGLQEENARLTNLIENGSTPNT